MKNVLFSIPLILLVSCSQQLLTTGFINEDGKLAIVVMNQTNKKTTYNNPYYIPYNTYHI